MDRQAPPGPDHLHCPLWRKRMSRVCRTCPWWVKVAGMDPQDQTKQIDHWNCAIAFNVPLSIELGRQMRSNAAATETVAAEMQKADKASDAMIGTLLTVVNRAIPAQNVPLASPSAPKLLE